MFIQKFLLELPEPVLEEELFELLAQLSAPFPQIPDLIEFLGTSRYPESAIEGIFLWQTREAALAFESELRDILNDLNPTKLEIDCFSCPIRIDNEHQRVITSW